MRFLIILLFLLWGMSWCFGQASANSLQDKNLVELRQMVEDVPILPRRSHVFPQLSLFTLTTPATPSRPVLASGNIATLPAAWRYEDLALFCKIEVKMEKALSMPVKFRLGEVQYVERMEGKLQTGVNYMD